MKRILMMIGLCLATIVGSAQKLQVSKPKLYVGKTGFEMPITATFELKNNGSRHLTIADVKADCGCTKVLFPKKSISAGASFTISMTYDARLLGHFSKQAAVYVKGSSEPLWLTMEGVVLTEWTDFTKMYPYTFGSLLADVNNVEFDDVNKGEHPEVVINVLNNGEKTMTPNVLHMPDYLTAFAEPEKLEPEKSGKIILTLNSDKIQNFGLTQTTVYLAEQLGDKVNADIELPVSVVLLPNAEVFKGGNKMFAPKLELSSDSLTLGLVDGHQVNHATLKLTNKGRTALSISSLQMFAQGMTVMLGKQELAAGESTKLKVTIDRDVILKARQRPRVLMITNDPEHSKVVIKVGVK